MLTPDRAEWLADAAQPAARYRYLVEVEGRKPDSKEAVAARRQIPRRGWAADILMAQDPRGFWVHRDSLYVPKYVSTNWRLIVLAELGLTADHPGVRRAVDLMLEDYGSTSGPLGGKKRGPHLCFTGNTTRMMILLGLGDDPRVRASLDWFAGEQKEDGGWDCFGRPKGTLDGWEGLAAFAALGRRRWTRTWKAAVERGAEFYLERGLLREGRNRYVPWERLHYPVHYYYDVLVGLETVARLGYGDDPRLRPALDLLERKGRPDGTWSLDAVQPDLGRGANYDVDPGTRRFALERAGAPSKWITLRARSVLGPS